MLQRTYIYIVVTTISNSMTRHDIRFYVPPFRVSQTVKKKWAKRRENITY